jgi:hypothetical protein
MASVGQSDSSLEFVRQFLASQTHQSHLKEAVKPQKQPSLKLWIAPNGQDPIRIRTNHSPHMALSGTSGKRQRLYQPHIKNPNPLDCTYTRHASRFLLSHGAFVSHSVISMPIRVMSRRYLCRGLQTFGEPGRIVLLGVCLSQYTE